MNQENIKLIVNSGNANWEKELLAEIAKGEDAIPCVLAILDYERKDKQSLITDLNFQLSRAHLALEEPKANKDNFVSKEIRKFYKEGRVTHCFKMD